ncbi:hypothetical protein PP707_03615 [Acetobacter pasteurianus]|nr:hypothetical protein [Acetobacter pasteurianus]
MSRAIRRKCRTNFKNEEEGTKLQNKTRYKHIHIQPINHSFID